MLAANPCKSSEPQNCNEITRCNHFKSFQIESQKAWLQNVKLRPLIEIKLARPIRSQDFRASINSTLPHSKLVKDWSQRKCSTKEIWSLDLSYLWHRLYPSHLLIQLLSCRCAVLGSWRVPVFSSRGAGICWGKPLSGQVKAHFVKLYLSSLSDRSPYDVMGTSLPCKRSHLKRETRHLNLV